MHLSDEQREKLARIATEHGVDLLILFGSMVSGKTHERSDVDLGVRFQPGADASWRALGNLSMDLQEVFGERDVDLGLLNHADPLFLWHIASKGELLVGDPTRFAELKILAFKRYVDHRRFLEMETRYVRSRLSA